MNIAFISDSLFVTGLLLIMSPTSRCKIPLLFYFEITFEMQFTFSSAFELMEKYFYLYLNKNFKHLLLLNYLSRVLLTASVLTT